MEGPAALVDVQREVDLDEVALEAARRFVEDTLVWRRDARVFVLGGNGLVIRERNGEESCIMRLSTRDALTLGIRAYLASLGRTS